VIGRERLRALLALAGPILGGMASQNLVNLADTAMVGRLGQAAVAAVGIASFANFMAIAAITGLGSAVQAMAARRIGEGAVGEAAAPLHGGLFVAVVVGLPLSAALWWASPWLFPWLNADPEVVAHGVPYLQSRLAGTVFVGANFSFRGFFNGIGRSDLYLRTLVVMHTVNVAVSLLLIYGVGPWEGMGSLGAGVGSTIASAVGTAMYVAIGLREARSFGLLRSWPSADGLAVLLRLALPGSVQQLLFAAGFTALFAIVGRIGTAETAAANVLVNVTMVAVLPGLGFGIAGASLVGQALGRGDPEDARRWGWETAQVAAVVMGVLGAPMWAAPGWIVGLFVPDAPAVIAAASTPLRLAGLMLPLDGVGLVLMNCLLGAGAARSSAAVSIGSQWGIGLPLAYACGVWWGLGLTAVWAVQVGQRALQAALFVGVWRDGSWTRARA
jgi:putative MATE family efflux protein